MVQVADFGPIVKQHPVALPIEPIGEQHLALGSRDDNSISTLNVDRRTHAIADPQIDLISVGSGQRVGLPNRHLPILPDERWLTHAPTSIGQRIVSPIGSSACEEFG